MAFYDQDDDSAAPHKMRKKRTGRIGQSASGIRWGEQKTPPAGQQPKAEGDYSYITSKSGHWWEEDAPSDAKKKIVHPAAKSPVHAEDSSRPRQKLKITYVKDDDPLKVVLPAADGRDGKKFIPLEQWLGDFLYRLGARTEQVVRRTLHYCRKGLLLGLHLLAAGARGLAHLLMIAPRAIANLFAQPFIQLNRGFHNISEMWQGHDPDDPWEALRDIFRYAANGVRKHCHFVVDLVGWLLPVAAVGVLAFTVHTVMNYRYVLSVSYDGQMLGYIEKEDVYEEAERQVRQRIVYTSADQERGAASWDIQPTFNLSVADTQKVVDSNQLADVLLEASGEEIVEATGLYIDGTFYGAVRDRDSLQSAINAILQPYQTGESGTTVGFVQDVELQDGVYLTSNIQDNAVVEGMLTQEVSGEKSYTVQRGDTPSGIASGFGVTTAELYAMNPAMEDGNNLHVGDVLVVSQAVPFLQVKVVKTTVETEYVDYNTVRTTTTDLKYGTVQTVTSGQQGVNEVTYESVYIDGVLTERNKVNTTVISEPVDAQILIGASMEGVQITTNGFAWPIPGYTYVSRGWSGLYAHNGMDICGAYGTPITAAAAGVVTKALYTNVGYGIYVIVNHGNGYSTLYGHCSALAVGVGDVVSQGQVIAYMGSTGNSTGNHCHFEVRINNVQQNPALYIGSSGR